MSSIVSTLKTIFTVDATAVRAQLQAGKEQAKQIQRDLSQQSRAAPGGGAPGGEDAEGGGGIIKGFKAAGHELHNVVKVAGLVVAGFQAVQLAMSAADLSAARASGNLEKLAGAYKKVKEDSEGAARSIPFVGEFLAKIQGMGFKIGESIWGNPEEELAKIKAAVVELDSYLEGRAKRGSDRRKADADDARKEVESEYRIREAMATKADRPAIDRDKQISERRIALAKLEAEAAEKFNEKDARADLGKASAAASEAKRRADAVARVVAAEEKLAAHQKKYGSTIFGGGGAELGPLLAEQEAARKAAVKETGLDINELGTLDRARKVQNELQSIEQTAAGRRDEIQADLDAKVKRRDEGRPAEVARINREIAALEIQAAREREERDQGIDRTRAEAARTRRRTATPTAEFEREAAIAAGRDKLQGMVNEGRTPQEVLAEAALVNAGIADLDKRTARDRKDRGMRTDDEITQSNLKRAHAVAEAEREAIDATYRERKEAARRIGGEGVDDEIGRLEEARVAAQAEAKSRREEEGARTVESIQQGAAQRRLSTAGMVREAEIAGVVAGIDARIKAEEEGANRLDVLKALGVERERAVSDTIEKQQRDHGNEMASLASANAQKQYQIEGRGLEGQQEAIRESYRQRKEDAARAHDAEKLALLEQAEKLDLELAARHPATFSAMRGTWQRVQSAIYSQGGGDPTALAKNTAKNTADTAERIGAVREILERFPAKLADAIVGAMGTTGGLGP